MIKFNENKIIIGETKSNHIYKILKQAILQGNLMQGEKLVVSNIAKSYNISTIPVREAFNRLEVEGLVTIVPHTGIHVKKIETEHLKELYPIRAILEGYAIRLATPLLKAKDLKHLRNLIKKMDKAIEVEEYSEMGHLNYEFHMSTYRACKNKSLVEIINELWQKTIIARLIFNLMPHRALKSNLEHKRIIEALENKDEYKAERLVIEQNEKTLDMLIRFFENKSNKSS